MIDAHSHLLSSVSAPKDFAALAYQNGVEGVFLCAAREGEWNTIETLDATDKGVMPFFGVHAWFAEAAAEDSAFISRLEKLLRDIPYAGVGEIGLDKLRPSAHQREVFVSQFELALKYNRVINLHCVKEWDNILSIFKEYNKNLPPVILHSFSGYEGIIAKLSEYGCYFSFSALSLHKNNRKMKELFAKIPPERFLLESDAPDVLASPAQLPDFAAEFADYIGQNASYLCALSTANAERIRQWNR